MRRYRLFLLPALFTSLLGAADSGSRRITRAELRDRIEGGWAGQMIGVSYGAPTEFRSLGKIIEGELPKWTPDRVANSLNQDDLYVDMTFAQYWDRVNESIAPTTGVHPNRRSAASI